MSPITTHVLDTARGCPAEGLPIRLEIREGDSWSQIAEGVTNADGRIADLMQPGDLAAKTYRMTFDTGRYFESAGTAGFYPYVSIVFQIEAPQDHYHVPLLLSPFGYSTYRGS